MRIDVPGRPERARVAVKVGVVDVEVRDIRVRIQVDMAGRPDPVRVLIRMGIDVWGAGIGVRVDVHAIRVIGMNDVSMVSMGICTSRVLVAGIGVVTMAIVEVIRVATVGVIAVTPGPVAVVPMVSIQVVGIRRVKVISVRERSIVVVSMTGVVVIHVRLRVLVTKRAVRMISMPVVYMVRVTAGIDVIGVVGKVEMVGVPSVGVVPENRVGMAVRMIGVVFVRVAVTVAVDTGIAVIAVRRIVLMRKVGVRRWHVGVRRVIVVAMVVVGDRRRIDVHIGMDNDLVLMRHIAVHVVVDRRRLRRGGGDAHRRHHRHHPTHSQ